MHVLKACPDSALLSHISFELYYKIINKQYRILFISLGQYDMLSCSMSPHHIQVYFTFTHVFTRQCRLWTMSHMFTFLSANHEPQPRKINLPHLNIHSELSAWVYSHVQHGNVQHFTKYNHFLTVNSIYHPYVNHGFIARVSIMNIDFQVKVY